MKKIIFVYNADSGPVAGLRDMIHKIVSPKTYTCNLCSVTYGSLGMRPEWRRFVERLDAPVEFLHRDELADRYGLKDAALPAAFLETEAGKLETWIDAETMNGFASLDDLMAHVTHLAEHD